MPPGARGGRDTTLGSFTGPETVAVTPRSEEPPLALGVAALIAAVNATLDEPRFADVWVRGEVSGFKPASSGHWYFDLKDDSAVLNVAMFRNDNARIRFALADGMEVLVRGRVAVFAKRSQLQVVARDIRPVGAGALQLAFEQTKRRLAAEGLFAPERKRALPPHPRRIGIVTSLNAAALRDLVRVATERHPGVRLLVANARVQGDGAAAEIAAAIARLDATDCDVLIVGRGGGSIEDLWAFNEEVVVRAVAGSRIPVVSAVGHETDVTLCDLAADARASTPSNAAELVVPDAGALLASLDDADARLEGALMRLVPELRQQVDELQDRAADAVRRAVALDRERVGRDAARLDALSPLATLARGYAVARKDGKLLRSAKDAPVGSDIEVVLKDGALDARVTRSRRKDDDDEG